MKWWTVFMDFIEIKTKEQFQDALKLIHELNPQVNRGSFLTSMRSELSKHQKLFGLSVSGQLVSLASVWLLITGLNERLFWINAFVTTNKMRSKGYGQKLLAELEKYAIKENFDEIRVHTHREKAISFWKEKAQFKIFSTVLRKPIH